MAARGQGRGQMRKLAGEILVDEQDLHALRSRNAAAVTQPSGAAA